MLKKIMSLGLAFVMMVTLGMNAFAANAITTTDVNNILEDIIEYSTYNYETEKWELDYAIVEDGKLTDAQYHDAEIIGDYYSEHIDNNTPQTRALPAAVVLVLKAIAAAGGAALVAAIVDDIYTFGMTAACENFSDVELFYDFCTSNGYL